MHPANHIITESLAPAVAVTGIALLLNGMNGRFSMAATRVRELNKELRNASGKHRTSNIKQQIPLFMRRAFMIRNSMFLLFGSLGMMVFTTASIALSRLRYLDSDMVSVWSFLGGLVMMMLAVIIEAYETILNLRTLSLDVDHSTAMADERQQKASGLQEPALRSMGKS